MTPSRQGEHRRAMDRSQRTRRRHPRRAQSLARSGSRCAARSSSSPAPCSRCCSRRRASRRSGSAPPPSSRSASSRSPSSSGCCASAFVRPLRRRVTDAQVALYLEERESDARSRDPERRRSRPPESGGHGSAHSPRLVEKLVEQAIEQCRAIDDGRVVEQAAFRRHAVTLAGVGVGARAARRARPGVSAARAVGAARSCPAAPKRRARTGSTSRPATRRFRAAPIRRSRAKLVGFTSHGRRRDDAHGRRTRRSSACRSSRPTQTPARSRACCSTSRSRSSTTSSRTACGRRRSR